MAKKKTQMNTILETEFSKDPNIQELYNTIKTLYKNAGEELKNILTDNSGLALLKAYNFLMQIREQLTGNRIDFQIGWVDGNQIKSFVFSLSDILENNAALIKMFTNYEQSTGVLKVSISNNFKESLQNKEYQNVINGYKSKTITINRQAQQLQTIRNIHNQNTQNARQKFVDSITELLKTYKFKDLVQDPEILRYTNIEKQSVLHTSIEGYLEGKNEGTIFQKTKYQRYQILLTNLKPEFLNQVVNIRAQGILKMRQSTLGRLFELTENTDKSNINFTSRQDFGRQISEYYDTIRYTKQGDITKINNEQISSYQLKMNKATLTSYNSIVKLYNEIGNILNKSTTPEQLAEGFIDLFTLNGTETLTAKEIEKKAAEIMQDEIKRKFKIISS